MAGLTIRQTRDYKEKGAYEGKKIREKGLTRVKMKIRDY
jgi:hypothetical protein